MKSFFWFLSILNFMCIVTMLAEGSYWIALLNLIGCLVSGITAYNED